MGYHTEFDGELQIDPPLNATEIECLNDFFSTRHPGPLDEFFTKEPNWLSEMLVGDDIRPKPGVWCDLKATATTLAWNRDGNGYEFAAWVGWVIDHLLGPQAKPVIAAHLAEDQRLAAFTCDHVVDGAITAHGEDPDDRWALLVRDNVVETSQSTPLYGHQVLITPEQAESWAGRRLDANDLNRLRKAIGNSSIPAAIEEIVAGFDQPS